MILLHKYNILECTCFYYTRCVYWSMTTAAEYGHLNIVKWLHKNNFECTTNAMDLAALNGHLEVVKWLHFNRNSGCTYRIFRYNKLVNF